jgi:hypothetical protein
MAATPVFTPDHRLREITYTCDLCQWRYVHNRGDEPWQPRPINNVCARCESVDGVTRVMECDHDHQVRELDAREKGVSGG